MTTSIEIAELRTLSDLNSLYQLASECTFTKEQYRTPLRPYRLIKAEASCQYQKHGRRCAQLHQHGYVVELHDASQVLIGNCCALNHLGLDDEQVRGQFKRLSATERQNIRRHRVETLLSQRQSLIERVRAANSNHRELQGRASAVLSSLPQRIGELLNNRWKSNVLGISWDYQVVKKGVDEKNKPYEERHWYPHSFGTLKGLGVWLQLGGQRYQERLFEMRKRLEAIPTKPRLNTAELESAEAALNDMTKLAVIERELHAQATLLNDFLEPSNLQLTVQLVSSHEARADTVKAVHRLLGQSLDVSPSQYVAAIDLAFKQRYSTGAIRIGS